MVSREWCTLFGKHCDFLEGIACLYIGTSLLLKFWILTFGQSKCKLHAIKIHCITNLDDIFQFACEPMCPSWHWLPEHSLVTQHESYSLWAWWSQVLSAGRAITSEDQCTSNQAFPYHEIKGHPSVQRVPGPQAFRIFVAKISSYIGWNSHHIFT